MPCDAKDDEAVAGDGAEGHHGDQEILERETDRIRDVNPCERSSSICWWVLCSNYRVSMSRGVVHYLLLTSNCKLCFNLSSLYCDKTFVLMSTKASA